MKIKIRYNIIDIEVEEKKLNRKREKETFVQRTENANRKCEQKSEQKSEQKWTEVNRKKVCVVVEKVDTVRCRITHENNWP